MSEWEKAKADLTQAVRLRPTFITAYVERARMSNLAEGKKDLNYVIRLRPEWPRGYYERAAHLSRYSTYNPTSETVQSVISDLNRAIEIDPAFVDAYRLRARMRRILKDVAGAIEDLNQVIRHDPDDLFAN